MKTVIHSKIPTNENGNILIPYEAISNFARMTKAQLGEDYILIVTPFETNKIDGDGLVLNFDGKDYSYNELNEIIEKAHMYDGLCK